MSPIRYDKIGGSLYLCRSGFRVHVDGSIISVVSGALDYSIARAVIRTKNEKRERRNFIYSTSSASYAIFLPSHDEPYVRLHCRGDTSTILVPQAVIFQWCPQISDLGATTDATGCACDCTIDAALEHATCELIERDEAIQFWRGRRTLDFVVSDWTTRVAPQIATALTRLHLTATVYGSIRKGRTVSFALLINSSGNVCVGSAASRSPIVSVEKAILESVLLHNSAHLALREPMKPHWSTTSLFHLLFNYVNPQNARERFSATRRPLVQLEEVAVGKTHYDFNPYFFDRSSTDEDGAYSCVRAYDSQLARPQRVTTDEMERYLDGNKYVRRLSPAASQRATHIHPFA